MPPGNLRICIGTEASTQFAQVAVRWLSIGTQCDNAGVHILLLVGSTFLPAKDKRPNCNKSYFFIVVYIQKHRNSLTHHTQARKSC